MKQQNPGDPLGMLKKPSVGYQPLKTFVARNVQPGNTSTIQLSGGTKIPYHYSLATTSTVPFAAVEGAGGIQKEFSWGEVIEIPPGITVSVKNSSKHAGDIIINGGKDQSNTPARISFPISFVPFGSSGDLYVQDGFIDTRRARRCYWVSEGFTAEADSNVVTLGYYSQHTANPEGNSIFDTASWISSCFLSLGDAVTIVPIALSADIATYVAGNMLPMMLADYERIILSEISSVPLYNFAVLEYL